MINAINGLASLFNMISQIIDQIMSVVSIITQIMMIANIIQTAIEVATCGIGAIITRVVLPVIAALVANYAIPEVVRAWTGLELGFQVSVNEILSVALGGIGELIRWLIMKILIIIMLVKVVHWINVKLSSFDIHLETSNPVNFLASAMVALPAVTIGTISKRANAAGASSNVGTAINNLMQRIQIPDITMTGQIVETLLQIWNSIKDYIDELRENDFLKAMIYLGILITPPIIILMKIAWARHKGERIKITEGRVAGKGKCLKKVLLYALLGIALFSAADFLLDPGKEFYELYYEPIKELIDILIVLTIVFDDLAQFVRGNITILPDKICNFLFKIVQKYWNFIPPILRPIIIIPVIFQVEVKKITALALFLGTLMMIALAARWGSRIGEEEIRKHIVPLVIGFASTTGLVTSTAVIAMKEIKEEAEKREETEELSMSINEISSQMEKESSSAFKLQILFDISAFITFFVGSFAERGLGYSIAMVICGWGGLIADILHDKKISLFDELTAFYLGIDTYMLIRDIAFPPHY